MALGEIGSGPAMKRGPTNKPSGPSQLGESISKSSHPRCELLTVIEAAEFLTISKSGVRRLQQARRLPFIKIGGGVRFARRDLLAFLEKQRVKAID